jgi:hypothetical protein
LSHSGSREDRPPWWFLPPGRLRRPVHLRSAAMNSPARFVGTIGGLAEDYLGRSKLEHERAIAASRIVEARGRPELREFNGRGPRTGTIQDADRFRRQPLSRLLGCVLRPGDAHRAPARDRLRVRRRRDLDPAVVVMLERAG